MYQVAFSNVKIIYCFHFLFVSYNTMKNIKKYIAPTISLKTALHFLHGLLHFLVHIYLFLHASILISSCGLHLFLFYFLLCLMWSFI